MLRLLRRVQRLAGTVTAWVKKHHPEIPVRSGNMVDGEAFTFLAKAGADFIEVGVGGSPICISRNQKGIGRGQASAVQDVAATRDAFRARTVRTDLLRWRTSTATVLAVTAGQFARGVVMGGDLAGVRLWAGELDALHERFVHRFNREEPRQSALAYMRDLVAPLQRKNGWPLAEEAWHAGPDRIHRLLNRIEWDADEVLEDVRAYVVEQLGDRAAVLIVDDTGFIK